MSAASNINKRDENEDPSSKELNAFVQNLLK